MAVIGADLGGTKLSAAIFHPDGSMALRETAPLEGRRDREIGKIVTSRILSLLERSPEPVEAIGVAVPGISGPEGTVWAPNLDGWTEYPLRDEIRAALPSPRIRVTVESDRACSILGETWRGAAQGCRNAIFLAIGTGIGAGILADGRILRGAGGVAGCLGWLAGECPWRREFARSGSLEYYASGEGIALSARRLVLKNTVYRGPLRDRGVDRITARDVFAAYDRDDPIAVTVLDHCIKLWGMTVADLVSAFNPEMIVFGGGIFGPAARFLDRIRTEASLWAPPVSMRQVTWRSPRSGKMRVL
ncbi:MAG: ROK family protein [Candidatus Latescibacterota bacterium]